MDRVDRFPRRSVVLVAAMIVASCSGDGGTTATTAPGPSTTAVVRTTAHASTSSVPASTTRPETTTTAAPAPVCDTAGMLETVDDTLALARLAPGGAWDERTDGVSFDARTDSAEEFARLLALDCSVRAVQRTDAGAERLLLAAWTAHRHGFVVQATDGPSTPYAREIRFQLFLEQPLGEWLVDQYVWAGSLSGGESIVLGAADHSLAVTAKSWQADVPPFEDLPVTLESEAYAIDKLRAAGARNVSVAEPAPFGSVFGSVQLNTHLGLPMIAAVAPADAFDPMVPILSGGSVFEQVGGVQVRVTAGLSTEYEVADAGWSCDGWSWRLYTGWGSVAEVWDFVRLLIASIGC